MSVLRPLDKQPGLNTATILLVGTEDALLQQLADSMLKEDCASELKVHLARSLPLPSNVNRPRIDLIVFVVNLHSKYREDPANTPPAHSVPVPATELGSTELVTTKTAGPEQQ
ncbi:centromere protein M [Leptonychotes weddellii]|uniref:Centromere protein M n=1 Tax=Leptonychotes weddellii TaxID=9713 RepID=A0A7F8QRM5_LEPWE|nr:centromere protein M [Leptonychotes weddellii]